MTWNEKNLDYEIETTPKRVREIILNRLEMKRTSITRLKLGGVAETQASGTAWNEKNLDYEIETGLTKCRVIRFFAWNEKNLDYEIETSYSRSPDTDPTRLEMKRTSITRLKRTNETWHEDSDATSSWNEKNLDYEIETGLYVRISAKSVRFWVRRQRSSFGISRAIRNPIPSCEIMSAFRSQRTLRITTNERSNRTYRTVG